MTILTSVEELAPTIPIGVRALRKFCRERGLLIRVGGNDANPRCRVKADEVIMANRIPPPNVPPPRRRRQVFRATGVLHPSVRR